MSGAEPTIRHVVVGVTTSDTANTIATTTLVAAPGAGWRIRVWAVHVVWNLYASAIGEITPYDVGTGSNFATMALSSSQRADGYAWPGGVPLTWNGALGVIHRASVASQNFRVTVSYSVEPT